MTGRAKEWPRPLLVRYSAKYYYNILMRIASSTWWYYKRETSLIKCVTCIIRQCVHVCAPKIYLPTIIIYFITEKRPRRYPYICIYNIIQISSIENEQKILLYYIVKNKIITIIKTYTSFQICSSKLATNCIYCTCICS